MPTQARRGHQILSWSYRQEKNSDPQEEQNLFLTTELWISPAPGLITLDSGVTGKNVSRR